MNWLQRSYDYLIVSPLYKLYRFGPRVHGVGFWKNATDFDICCALSTVDAQFWRQNPEKCVEIIRSDFNSYLIFLETFFYFLILYKLAQHSQLFFSFCRKNE